MTLRLLQALTAGLGLAACSQEAVKARPDELRVALFQDGRIEVDGKSASMAELEQALDKTKAKPKGTVAYYREGGDRDPSPDLQPKMRQVLEAIMARGKPIRLCSRPDFSDSVDEKGRTH